MPKDSISCLIYYMENYFINVEESYELFNNAKCSPASVCTSSKYYLICVCRTADWNTKRKGNGHCKLLGNVILFRKILSHPLWQAGLDKFVCFCLPAGLHQWNPLQSLKPYLPPLSAGVQPTDLHSVQKQSLCFGCDKLVAASRIFVGSWGIFRCSARIL